MAHRNSNTYTHSFINPYPNGWHNSDIAKDTSIDADALQAHTDAIEAMDNFLHGVNKDKIGNVQKSILTKAQYDALPDTKYSDGVIYFITDGGGSGTISYPNYEQEAF